MAVDNSQYVGVQGETMQSPVAYKFINNVETVEKDELITDKLNSCAFSDYCCDNCNFYCHCNNSDSDEWHCMFECNTIICPLL